MAANQKLQQIQLLKEKREKKNWNFVVLNTPHGNIKLQLLTQEAPKICEAFKNNVLDKQYEKTHFYKALCDVFIQGGIFLENKHKSFPPLSEESKVKITRGSVSLVAAPDHNEKATEFLIHLDDANGEGEHNVGFVFAKVVEGLDAADAISVLPIKESGNDKGSLKLNPPVLIKHVELVQN
eukprot:TRINITY_DN5793_c0_g1_i1.p1 TRINITY_DN5793_c0_g1~~TRINITY_DN5793_c0_g1_i1.p1  ORF type:complete len:181 (+),score=67.30 TRINITY_DN5793_c0_g1_i1:210-752(+)